jgi:hypothetical protein
MRKYKEQKPRGDLGTQSRSPWTRRENVDWMIWLRTEESGGKRRLRHTETHHVRLHACRLEVWHLQKCFTGLWGLGSRTQHHMGQTDNCDIQPHSTPFQAIQALQLRTPLRIPHSTNNRTTMYYSYWLHTLFTDVRRNSTPLCTLR